MRALGAAFFAAAILFSSSAFAAVPPPRSLPSLLIEWRWDGDADRMVVADGTVYVLGEGRATALDAITGEVLWQRTLAAQGSLSSQGLVLLAGHVAAAVGESVFLLDRGTGELRAARQLAGSVSWLVGPPLVARVLLAGEGAELVAIDGTSGEIRGRREAPATFGELAVQDGVVVTKLAHDEDEGTLLAGFDGSLNLLWQRRAPRYVFFEKWRGELYLKLSEGDDPTRFHPLNAATGKLGDALPLREASNVSGGLDWEFQLVHLSEHDASVRVQRNDPATGQPLWTVELPGHPTAWIEQGRRVLFHCDPMAGRGFLVVVDGESGAITETVYSLRDVRGAHLEGERLILLHDGGVAAVFNDRFGPPEASLHPVDRELDRILARLDADSYYGEILEAAHELRTLGPVALPLVADLLTAADGPRLIALAKLIELEEYYPAVGRLAQRFETALAAEPPPEAEDDERLAPAVAVLEALARLAGATEVPQLARVLSDPELAGVRWQSAETRWTAIAGLGRIASADALRAIDELRRPHKPSKPWWQAPDASDLVALAGRESSREEIDRAWENEDYERYQLFQRAGRSAVVEAAAGGRVVVFPDARYGGANDLWVAEVDDEGEVTSVAFLGSLAGDEEMSRCPALAARLSSRSLEVSCREPGFATLRRDLGELPRDTDGDGLSDLLEAKLHLDPRRADSDGDGVPDPLDLAPNARDGGPESEDEEIVHAIFELFFLAMEDTGGLAVIAGDSALEWRGRQGPTLTLSLAEETEFLRAAGYGGIAYITIVPVTENHEDLVAAVELQPGERHYHLSLYRGPLNAVGYSVVVKKAGERWLITRIAMAWIA